MTPGTAAVYLGPDSGGGLKVRQFTRRSPVADEIEVTVAAASVNPIDVRRAEGYGRTAQASFRWFSATTLRVPLRPWAQEWRGSRWVMRLWGEVRLRRGDPRQPRAGQGCPRAPRSGRPRPACTGGYPLQLRDHVARHTRSGSYPGPAWLAARCAEDDLAKRRHRARPLPKAHMDAFQAGERGACRFGQAGRDEPCQSPIGLRKSLIEAAEAFDNVRKGQPGRAVLLP